jgi:serpin B
LDAIETAFGTDFLAEVDGAWRQPYVDLALPTWEFRTQLSLTDPLKAMGMSTAFSEAADFSGMSPRPLLISDVLQEVFVSVDEKGTEAAAATAVIMRATGAPTDRVTLTVDRPYLFWIVDRPTGALLFLGRVTDPSAP